MDILRILDDFEETVQKSRRVPVTDKIIISEEVILDFLDRIRSILPEEIHRAKLLNRERERVIQEAQEEAAKILQEARQEAERITSESEIVKQAQSAAEEIVAQAKKAAREIRFGATEYADEILSRLAENLEKSLSVVRKAREELEKMK
ncbi:MAG: Archaeal/vacuolar-like H+-ATPase subunit H [Thermacetogenium phaeum]|uniref:Archaeal/vacuolar-like H+-ATPase subunit H n=1 Tax=Thermacetogenium phaeum TaxID=85874 RepID=A0A117LAL4_9THEO|nr:MAG: Archaeal/vacuolar-like H+-ATPase subunit H [Thermacetogenium phaeum]